MSRLFAATALTLVSGGTMPAFAAGEELPRLETNVLVTGKADRYRATATTSATKTDTPLLDVPQSVSVITRQQLDDQAILTVADLVRLIPGVSSGQGEGHRDQITLRGNATTADFFIDGLRDDVQYFRSFYNVERVEALKGPNAMVFGRGGGGGVINRVTKTPVLEQRFTDITASGTSFGGGYLAADTNVGGPRSSLRLNAYYESLANHRDKFDGERHGINPVLGFLVSDKTRVQVGFERVFDDRVVDRGLPSAFAGTLANPAGPLRGFRDTFFGVDGVNTSHFTADVFEARAETVVNEAITVRVSAIFGDYDKFYRNAYAATAVGGTAAAPTLGIEAYSDATQRQNLIMQGNVQWRVTTGPLDHVVLFGAEYTKQDTGSQRVTGFFDPLISSAANRRRIVALTDPVIIPRIFFNAGPSGNGNREVTSKLTQSSVYVQDQISIGEFFQVIGGVRLDRFDIAITNDFTLDVAGRVDTLVSPRLGLVFKPQPNTSFYASFSKSFLPQAGDQFLSLDATSAALEPEDFDNIEVGAKWDIRPDLSFSAAVYQLDRSNTRAAGPVPGSLVLSGKQRTKGAEFSLAGDLTDRWQIAFGYAWTDAEIVSTTSAAPAGLKVAQVPHHQVSLWNRFDLSPKFGVGLGLYYQAEQFTTISNTTVLPAYTRVDAAIFYKLSATTEVQLNIENLTDVTYFPIAHNDNNISTGAPLNARLTLKARF